MKRWLRTILLAAVLGTVVGFWLRGGSWDGTNRAEAGGLRPGAVERGGRPQADWRQDAIWDDGNAEFCAYETTWPRYGKLYTGRTLLILVKEPWAPDLNVKADRPRPDGFEVLKLNHLRDVPTGIYTYHQMASLHFRRETAALVKMATTSSEACGISTSLMVDGRLETHSYFDGQGDRVSEYPSGAVPEDGLPALLRDYVRGDPPAKLQVFPSLMMGRFAELEPRTYDVQKRRVDNLQVPAGSFTSVVIELHSAERNLSYFFEELAPFRLLRFQDSAGSDYRLVKSERIPYWNMHDPGGEDWLPQSVR